MLRNRYYVPLITLFALSLVGCAGTKKAAEGPHPLVGQWAFVIETPEGEERGTIKFSEVDRILQGSLSSNMPAGTADLEEIAFDASTSTLSFSFETGSNSVGRLAASAVLTGDTLEGSMTSGTMNMSVPLSASRVVVEGN